MKLIYGVKDKPKFGQVLAFSLQQMLAILAATIAVPAIVGNGMSASAALFGAGVGTIVYLLFTKFQSPVFLGSSFAFIGSMFAAFGGAASVQVGYLGLIIGALFAALVYVVIAIVVKVAGVAWIDKLMPAVVIGPTVSIIGLSLAANAVKDAVGCSMGAIEYDTANSTYVMNAHGLLCLLCALVTLAVVMICSVYGKKMTRMIPFIIGIASGYVLATIFTVIGNAAGIDAMKIVDFSKFANMQWVPDFTFVEAFKGFSGITPAYLGTLADHKNLSSIIEQDLLKNPGLSRTLLGDGVGSAIGAFFGGCPNTTYGESVGCVAISGNASVVTIFTTAILAILSAFVAPFVTFLATIPSCVMGGVCISLYGFIAVSGLKMIQTVDLGDNKNLFVVSVILITGIGNMCLTFGQIKLTSIACALILGILTNVLLSKKQSKTEENK